MRTNLKLFLGLFFVLVVGAILAISAQRASKKLDEPDVNNFPVLDYRNKDAEKASKRKRKKYNNAYAPKIRESSDRIVMISDWEMGLPAFPVEKSAAIIIGEVTAAQALLSEDETNIYSEFTVQINEIPKNVNDASLSVGDSVTVERLGGRLRLPSGKVVVSLTEKQDLPKVGNRYLLFLIRDIDDEGLFEDFNILTGYELRNGKAFPLDKLGSGHPISAYTGTDIGLFFADLNKVLASSSTSKSQ